MPKAPVTRSIQCSALDAPTRRPVRTSRLIHVRQHAEKKLEGIFIQQQERSMGSESPQKLEGSPGMDQKQVVDRNDSDCRLAWIIWSFRYEGLGSPAWISSVQCAVKVVELESTRLSSSLNVNLKHTKKMVIMMEQPRPRGMRWSFPWNQESPVGSGCALRWHWMDHLNTLYCELNSQQNPLSYSDVN